MNPKLDQTVAVLQKMGGDLDRLDGAAKFNLDPAMIADTLLDSAEKEVPNAALTVFPVLADLAAPLNREVTLKALSVVRPDTANRLDWYGRFLDELHGALTAPPEGGDTPAA